MTQPEVVRWGVLGTARITRRVAPAIHAAPSAQLVAIASRDVSRAKAWSEKYEAPVVSDSYEALLARDDLDAIYIPLPPHLHAEWTIAAARAGKHVLCEKPLAVTADDAARMIAVCREQQVHFEEGVMWYHHPRTTRIRELLDEQRLGEIRKITSAFSFPWQSTVDPENEYRLKKEQGGGSLLDLGWYCVGATLWVLRQTPLTVFGQQTPSTGVDDSFCGQLTFSDGVSAAFDCSRQLTSRRWIEIAGTEGSIVCDDFTRPWNEQKCRFWLHDKQGAATVFETATDNQETCLVENFSRRILSGSPNPQDGALALRTQQVIEQLQNSAASGHQTAIS